MHNTVRNRALMLIVAMTAITAASTELNADTGMCGGASITLPFTDVSAGNIFFCSIAEAYFSALTNGTDATHYSPSANVPREQMAAFVTRTMDQSLRRGSRRAALRQWWTPISAIDLALTTVGTAPQLVESDGTDLWAANFTTGSVSRVHASDGTKVGADWMSAPSAYGVLVAKGRIFVTGQLNPGRLYQIDPTQAPGVVLTVTNSLGANPAGLAFDGTYIWTANSGSPGSVSIVATDPIGVTTIITGFSSPIGVLYDGANIWVTDHGDNTLKKLDAAGNILQTVTVGTNPLFPVFDGTNIWVPNNSSSTVSVVRATGALAGTVLATLTGNGLSSPATAAFDGQRILVTNQTGSVSLWKASDLTPLGSVSTGAGSVPNGACSDGINFWIALAGAGKLARF